MYSSLLHGVDMGGFDCPSDESEGLILDLVNFILVEGCGSGKVSEPYSMDGLM